MGFCMILLESYSINMQEENYADSTHHTGCNNLARIAVILAKLF